MMPLFYRAFAVVLLISGVATASSAAPGKTGDSKPSTSAKRHEARATLRQKQATTVTRIKTVKTQLRQAKRSEAQIDADLATVQGRLQHTRARLDAEKAHLVVARKQQVQVAAALAASQKQLQKRETQLAERMASNYRQGPVRYMSVVLGSRSMGEMVSRAHVVKTLVHYDSTLVEQIKQDRVAVVKWKQEADAKAAEVADSTRQLGAEQDQQAEETQHQRAVLAEAKQRRAEFEQQLDDLQADSSAIESKIRALEETPLGHARTLIAFTGRFSRPVDAPIVSGFGMRFHPILHITRLHAGVDFGAVWGTPIGAAAEGIVAFSGVMHGYGNVVVIDHGGGLSTLYGHCSSRQVVEGQSVARGQIIAHVGATGLATGPHLHFEVRKNGTPVDPMGAL